MQIKIKSSTEQSNNTVKISKFIKLAYVCVKFSSLSKWMALPGYICSQLQILSILAFAFSRHLIEDSISLGNFFNYFHQVISIEYFINLERATILTLSIFLIVIAYFALIALCFCYLLTMTLFDKPYLHVFQKLWNILIDLHPVTFFYPIHFICLKIILYIDFRDGVIMITGTSSQFIQGITLTILTMNLFWSFFALFLNVIKIKTKNFFSSKTEIISLLDLTIKIVTPILILSISSEWIPQIALSSNFVWNLLRDCTFFYFLPYYRLSALKLALKFHALIASFTFAFMIPQLFRNRIHDQGMFSAIAWIPLFLAWLHFYDKKLQKLLFNVVLNPSTKVNYYHVLHYWDVYKYFSSKYSLPQLKTKKNNEFYIYHWAALQQSKTLKEMAMSNNLTQSNTPSRLVGEKMINNAFFKTAIDKLVSLSERQPKFWLLKVLLAYYYTKSEGSYILADRIIIEGMKTSLCPFDLKISLYLIKQKILNKIQKTKSFALDHKDIQEQKVHHLDVYRYIKLTSAFLSLSQDTLDQLNLKTKFWQDFQSIDPDFSLLVNLTKQAYKKAQETSKDQKYFKIFSENKFTKPILTQGINLIINQNELSLGLKFLLEYSNLTSLNRDKFYDASASHKKSQFHDAVHLLVSGANNTLGKILDCSSRIESFLGIQKDRAVGRSVNILMPLFYAERHNNFIKASFISREAKLLNKTRKIQAIDSDGYLVPCNIHLTLNTWIDDEICYYGLLTFERKIERVVLARRNGSILGFTKNFGRDVNIFRVDNQKEISIFSLCPELEEVFKAFSVVISNNKKQFNTDKISIPIEKLEGESKKLTNLQAKKVEMIEGTETSLFADQQDTYQKFSKGHCLTCYPRYTMKDSEYSKSLRQPLTYDVKIEHQEYDDEILFTLTMMDTTKNSFGFSKTTQIPLKESLIVKKNKSILTPSTKAKQDFGTLNSEPNFNTHNSILKSGKTPKKITLQKWESHDEKYETSEKVPNTLNSEQNLFSPTKINLITYEENVDAIEGTNSYSTFPAKLVKPKTHHDKMIVSSPGDKDALQIKDIETDQAIEQTEGNDQILEEESSIETDKNGTAITMETMKFNLTQYMAANQSRDENGVASFSYPKIFALQKTIKQVLMSKKYKKSTIYYGASSCFAILFQLTFLIWLNFYTSTISREVEYISKVTQNAYFREAWIKMSNIETRSYTAMRSGLVYQPGIIDEPIMLRSINTTYYSIIKFNNLLRQSVQALESTVQNRFYEKGIQVIERDSYNKIYVISTDNTFEATEKIINNGLKNVQLPPIRESGTYNANKESRFIFDNSFDDYLLKSSELTKLMENQLESIFLNSAKVLMVTLGITLFILAIFVFVSVLVVRQLNRDFTQLMEMLSVLQKDEVQNVELFLSKFKKVLEKDCDEGEIIETFSETQINIRSKQFGYSSSSNNLKRKSKKEVFRASMKNLHYKNNTLLGKLLVCLSIMIILLLIYYNQASDKIVIMENQQSTINSALRRINTQALIGAEIQTLILDNETTLIKGGSVLTNLETDLKVMGSILDIENSFKDKDGAVSPKLKEILFHVECSESYTPLYNQYTEDYIVQECYDLSRGSGYLGLIDLTMFWFEKITLVVQKFKTSSRGEKELKELYLESFDYFFRTNDHVIGFLLLAYTSVTEDFASLSQSLEQERAKLAWIAVIVSVILGELIWYFVIREIIKKEFERKRVLLILPTKLIMSNPQLIRHLVHISDPKYELKKLFVSI